MKQFCISLCLLVAFVVQSIVAVNDSTIDLAIEISHMKKQHMHTSNHYEQHHFISTDEQSLLSIDSNEITNSLDNGLITPTNHSIDEQKNHAGCHHCGHCTTPHVIWQINSPLIAFNSSNEINPSVESFTFSDVIDNTYRPPIV